MKCRAFLLASALGLPIALGVSPRAPLDGTQPAEATVAVLMSLEDMVRASAFVVTATAGERYSQWEELPSGRRIVTYTRLAVEQAHVGAPGGEVWVRTLGGAVGRIGQTVAGEAQIARGSRSILFLARIDGALVVTGMAQGHFPIVSDDNGAERLASSPDAGLLLPRRGPTISAREVLLGARVAEATVAITRARQARDGK